MSRRAPQGTDERRITLYNGVAHFARRELFTRGFRTGFVTRAEVSALVREYQLNLELAHALEESLRMAQIEIRAASRTG